MVEEIFEGKDGVKLMVRSWRPFAGGSGNQALVPSEEKPRAAVVIVHGFKSHSGHYLRAAREMQKQGLAVYALDLRGHGLSEGERLYVDKFSDYIEDVKKLVDEVHVREPGLPVFLFGHSAGGVIATSYALDYADTISGLISESFAHEVPAPAIVLSFVKGLRYIAPRAGVLKLEDEGFSRDKTFVASMINDPLIPRAGYPANTVAEMVIADERLRREFPSIKLPVLILHGTEDRVTLPSGSKRFGEFGGSEDKTLKLYEGAYHDLLNDVGKEQVLSDVIGWVNQRAA